MSKAVLYLARGDSMSTQKAAHDLVSPAEAASLPIAQPHRNAGWIWWLRWTAATTAGWIIGGFVYSAVMYALNQTFIIVVVVGSFGMLAGAMFAGITAATFGFMQGLVIRQIGVSVRSWMVASMIGGIIGGAISAGPVILFPMLLESVGGKFHWLYSQGFGFLSDIIILAACGLITGMIIGYRQRHILSDTLTVNLHWVKVNALGWAMGCAVIVPASWLLCGRTLYPFWGVLGGDAGQNVMTIALCGLVGGATTGYPLIRAVQRSRAQNPKSEIQNESTPPRVG
jgi:hypothetical protein